MPKGDDGMLDKLGSRVERVEGGGFDSRVDCVECVEVLDRINRINRIEKWSVWRGWWNDGD